MDRAEQVSEIIASETDKYYRQVWKRAKPIVQREFDRLHKKHPSFEKILFGNGTFLVSFEDDREMKWSDDPPKDFKLLWDMCNELINFAQEDIVPTDKE